MGLFGTCLSLTHWKMDKKNTSSSQTYQMYTNLLLAEYKKRSENETNEKLAYTTTKKKNKLVLVIANSLLLISDQ